MLFRINPPTRRLFRAQPLFAPQIAAKIGTRTLPRQLRPAQAPLARQPGIGQKRLAPEFTRRQRWRMEMAGMVESKLRELAITLKQAPAPVANYVPYVRTGNLLMVSGQLCFDGDGKLAAKGQLGSGVSIEDGQKAARACAVNLLAQVKAAIADLDKVLRVVRLGGFINSAPGFLDGPKVMNGASDLMVAAFGDRGKHARTTVGVAALPADAAVEVEGLFEVL
jgi:enamine deaminase RidA (YjgF/YER057c/UK114 family)